MRREPVTVLTVVVLAAAGCRKPDDAGGPPGWELKPPAADALLVAAERTLPGVYPAGSRIPDREAFGGFGPCDNYPFALAGRDWGTPGAVALVAFPDEPAAYAKHRGFAVRVVNRTTEALPFAACDSLLALVCEARDAAGVWREIESVPRSECGNSYHRVFLGPGEYWQFPAREYAGQTPTRLRFRLDPGAGRPAVYSNEFDGRIAAAQFAGG